MYGREVTAITLQCNLLKKQIFIFIRQQKEGIGQFGNFWKELQSL